MHCYVLAWCNLYVHMHVCSDTHYCAYMSHVRMQEARLLLDKYQSVAGGAMGRVQRAFCGPSDYFVSQ